MWLAYALLAHEIILDRQREAAAAALARQGAMGAAAPRGALSERSPWTTVGLPRRVIAAFLRRVAAVAGWVSAAARGMAARLEGQPEGRIEGRAA